MFSSEIVDVLLNLHKTSFRSFGGTWDCVSVRWPISIVLVGKGDENVRVL